MELYKEIKKNGPARCVRAALTRFSQLARHIRPAKCRPYLVNLLPCLQSLAARSEEQLHESLAAAFPNLFAVLGPHSNDNEIRISAANRSIGSTTGCTITEKAPTRAFSWLKAESGYYHFHI